MTRRRFIAGATCPACQSFDTVYIVRGEDGESRHCTRCDLSEARPAEVPAASPASEWKPVRLPGSSDAE